MSLSKVASINVFWSTLEQLLRKGFSVIVTLLLAWWLVPEDFGMIAIIAMFIEISYVLVGGGVVDAIVAKKVVDQIDLDTAFYINILLGFFICTLIYFSAPFIATFYEQPQLTELIQLSGLALVFQSFSVVPMALLIKNVQFKLQMKIALPSSVLSGIVAVIMAYFDYGIWALIAQMLITPFLSAILYWRLRLWLPKWQFSFTSLRYIISFSWLLLIEEVLKVFSSQLVPLILAKFFPLSVLGYYYFANKIRTIIVEQVMGGLNRVTYSVFASIQDDKERLRNGFSKVVGFASFLLFPILLLSAAVAPLLFDLFLDDKWKEATWYLQLMLLAALFYPFSALANNVFMAVHQPKLVFFLGMMSRVVTLTLLYFSIPYGIEGVLIGAIISSFISLLIYLVIIRHVINYALNLFIKDSVIVLVISLLLAGVIHFQLNFFEIPNYAALILMVLFFLFFYLVLSYLAKVKSFIYFYNIFISKFFRR